jgi:aspartyl-tRNA(Asn)/glutamyl-tRNA(Gln) amidotransferase subunit B
MPGTLPVLNMQALEYTIRAGLALNCTISSNSRLDRKNYFYPDLPKAYQISQLYEPLCTNGYIDISNTDKARKRINIREIHIEEDAGKLIHDEWESETLVDYNRCGVPLIEIVSQPDLRSASEVLEYLEKLKAILEYSGVSDCKMQEGSLRADVNLSVRSAGSSELGVRTEMKNLNSFKAIFRAVESEAARQIREIKSGGSIIQETRRWDDIKGVSTSMRSKEDAHEYRYFPDPDLVPLKIDEKMVKKIKESLPELPEQRLHRYISELGLPEYDASVITTSLHLSKFLDEAVSYGVQPKTASNWIMGDLLRLLNDANIEAANLLFGGEALAKLVLLAEEGRISNTAARKVFKIMFETGREPSEIVETEELGIVNDQSLISEIVKKVLAANPKSVADYMGGKLKASGYLLGQIMKEIGGKADPQTVGRLLTDELSKIIGHSSGNSDG